MEKRNVIEAGRTPGFVKKATAIPDEFEKKAKSVFDSFKERKPAQKKQKPVLP
jgi:hypothetical protein